MIVCDNPQPARPLESFQLFAVIGSWHEGDVIAATVANAFAQGCESVFLVDNDSPDDTVEQAIAAGAVLARRFSSARYEEPRRIQLMNEVVADISSSQGHEHVWWLWLDADEFPHGSRGRTLREQLAQLDRSFRVVGARFFDHYPSERPCYTRGRHPLEFQPLCTEFSYPMCPAGHRKHPLQRYDRSGAALTSGLGFHTALCAEPLFEPSDPVLLHHFPFREEGPTRARMEALCGRARSEARGQREEESTQGMYARHRSLDAVYARDWDRVEDFRGETSSLGVRLRHWSEAVSPDWTTATDCSSSLASSRREPPGSPALTVVVCTYQRPPLLRQALESLLAQPRDPARCEILVVDNDADAEARSCVEGLAVRHSALRYSHEPLLGLAHARNRGWRDSRGVYVGYIDDDARATPQWLARATRLAEEGVALAFGGPYYAFYDSPKAAWYKDSYYSHDQGPETRPLGPQEFLSGTNFFVRRDLLSELGGFDPRLGMAGREIFYGEETDLILRLRSAHPEALVLYEPTLAVEHLVATHKMKLSWVLTAAFADGRSSYQVFPVSRTVDWRKRGLKALVGLIGDLAYRAHFRDRNAYPFLQQYLYEVSQEHVKDLGATYQDWLEASSDPGTDSRSSNSPNRDDTTSHHT